MNKSKFIKLLEAIADETRLKIIRMISKGETSCLNITRKIKMSQPTISHHLKILADSGLVKVRWTGRYGFFSINENVFNSLSEEIKKIIKQRR